MKTDVVLEDNFVGGIHDQLTSLVKIKGRMPPAHGSAQLLTREQISGLIKTAFWASLEANEERTTRVCVAVAAPESFPDAVAFATPIAYDESQIVKLAPAVPRGGCLVVSGSSNPLCIWGFGRSRPGSWVATVTIEVLKPGTVLVGVGPFQPYAVLNARAHAILARLPDYLSFHLERVLQKAAPADDILETQAVWRECGALATLARLIVAHGHGGIVLIVPSETGSWSDSLSPFPYRFAAPDTTIRDAIRQELTNANAQGEILQLLSEAPIPDDLKNLVIGAAPAPPWGGMERGVHATASLTEVDGAVLMTRDLQVLGFGATIAVKNEGGRELRHVLISKPELGRQAPVLSQLEALGGTRHQSAARFIAANQDAVALVISQDHHLSVMHWHKPSNLVAVIRNAEWSV
jgi:hypothetical protein